MNSEGNVIPLRPQKLTCGSVTSLVRTSQPITIEAQSYAEVSANINREQLVDQECVVQPLTRAPVAVSATFAMVWAPPPHTMVKMTTPPN